MVNAPCDFFSNGKVIPWAQCMHFKIIRTEHMLLIDVNAADGLYSASWGQMKVARPRTKQELEEQVEDNKAERHEKREKWGKVLENHRDMILNFTSKDGNLAALSPKKELLEAMNCTTLAETESKVRSKLKSHGVRVKIPIILIKSLCTVY